MHEKIVLPGFEGVNAVGMPLFLDERLFLKKHNAVVNLTPIMLAILAISSCVGEGFMEYTTLSTDF